MRQRNFLMPQFEAMRAAANQKKGSTGYKKEGKLYCQRSYLKLNRYSVSTAKEGYKRVPGEAR